MSAAPEAGPRHAARRSRAPSIALPIGLAITAIGTIWALGDVPPVSEDAVPPMPVTVMRLPAVDLGGTVAADPCADERVHAALAAGDGESAIDAFGGGEAFREAVVAGNAPCVSLRDPTMAWVVVNKNQSVEPIDFAPSTLVQASLITASSADRLRGDVAEALAAMSKALTESGAGVLGMDNGYRSYSLQVTTHAGHVDSRGQEAAEHVSARPGFSEHQTGLAVDVVSCQTTCGTLGGFGGTSESDWVAEHAWEYGFIVRYEEGAIGTTGYAPEPWHLRYIGPALATAYHDGGYRTLEEFFGLPAAPDYVH